MVELFGRDGDVDWKMAYIRFSEKFENHLHMVALYAVWYNFVELHKTLKMTPALGAGISNPLWSMEDVLALIDACEASPRKRDPYKPRDQAAA
jgi:hypothetical protein